jgi:hypothetical protein
VCWVDSGPDGTQHVADTIRQLGHADDVKNVRGRNTTVRLYQEEVWEGTCNCLGPECVGWLTAGWQQVYLLTSHRRKLHLLSSLKFWYCYCSGYAMWTWSHWHCLWMHSASARHWGRIDLMRYILYIPSQEYVEVALRLFICLVVWCLNTGMMDTHCAQVM